MDHDREQPSTYIDISQSNTYLATLICISAYLGHKYQEHNGGCANKVTGVAENSECVDAIGDGVGEDEDDY